MSLLVVKSRICRTLQRNKLLLRCVRTLSDVSSVPEVVVPFPNGRPMKIATGRHARLSDGSAVVTLGDTSVMATSVARTKPSASSFLPLVVDYRQKSQAAGRITMNHVRRELGPTDREILTGRLIDRSLRPLFPEQFTCDTQVVCDVLAADGVYSPDVISINAASAALALSNIPWNGPVGAVRVGFIDNEVIINPTRKELESSILNLVISATKRNMVVMLEGHANCILQQDLLKAIKAGTKEAQHVINSIELLQKTHGKPKRALEPPVEFSDEVLEALRSLSEMRIRAIFNDYSFDKLGRDRALSDVRTDVLDKIKVNFQDLDMTLLNEEYNKVVKQVFRDLIFEEDRRCDGRRYDELRRIECEVNMYKPLHGCAVFQRGQTQVYCTVTLDSHRSALKMDTMSMLMSGVQEKNFFLHYEFPPFATNEIGRIGPISRREIGHGALAEKGLMPSIPDNYPFTIKLASEVLESNGSSSMASVCGGTLALLDAGVPLNAPAAGVAIGLVTRYDAAKKDVEDYRLLTDILGIEDYMGDMDFKIAGTKKGFTALQADVKIPGLPLKIVMEAIQKATDAKSRILEIMNECIDSPRRDKKDCWPVSEKLNIDAAKRSRLFGIGGINVRNLYAQTGVQVDQIDDTTCEIFAPSQQAMDEGKEIIEKLINTEREPELEFGGIYTAKIMEIRNSGVMVVLLAHPNMPPALLHNSQLDQRKVAHPSALNLQVGEEIQVKYFGRDPVSGFMRLSRRALQLVAQ